jgi:hypothetical protein
VEHLTVSVLPSRSPWFKKAWIIGQLYVMTAMVIFVMGAAAIIGNL